jgi:hypothetical protein
VPDGSTAAVGIGWRHGSAERRENLGRQPGVASAIEMFGISINDLRRVSRGARPGILLLTTSVVVDNNYRSWPSLASSRGRRDTSGAVLNLRNLTAPARLSADQLTPSVRA